MQFSQQDTLSKYSLQMIFLRIQKLMDTKLQIIIAVKVANSDVNQEQIANSKSSYFEDLGLN